MASLNKPLLVSLDLEFNQPSQRIIQIGAVVGDLRTRMVVSRFNAFVNPGEPLNPAISTLCGIAPEVLSLAGSLEEAFEELRAWLQQFDRERHLNPLTWGGGDSQALRAQMGLDDERWLFGRRWLDVKTVFSAWAHSQLRSADGGLATSMRRLGLRFEGQPHNAQHDAENTWRTYVHLVGSFAQLKAQSGATG